MENIAEKLHEYVLDSLYKDNEIPTDGSAPKDAIFVEGLTCTIGFHPTRLASHRAEVVEILKEMPQKFFKGTGDGCSVLALCEDRNGNQWGEHRNMQELLFLSIGLGLGEYVLPRETWPFLPGGLPYVLFNC